LSAYHISRGLFQLFFFHPMDFNLIQTNLNQSRGVGVGGTVPERDIRYVLPEELATRSLHFGLLIDLNQPLTAHQSLETTATSQRNKISPVISGEFKERSLRFQDSLLAQAQVLVSEVIPQAWVCPVLSSLAESGVKGRLHSWLRLLAVQDLARVAQAPPGTLLAQRRQQLFASDSGGGIEGSCPLIFAALCSLIDATSVQVILLFRCLSVVVVSRRCRL
jgi:hypothetical protein